MAEIAGLKLIVPSSVAGSGVSVSASGKVSFTATTSISINDCFSASYDNYLFVIKALAASTNAILYQFRSAGSNATGSNYAFQRLEVDNTTVSSSRFTGTTVGVAGRVGTTVSGVHFYIYGPHLAQPTAARSVSADSESGARVFDDASTHSLSTSYDGITLTCSANLTGSLCVYGLSQ